MILLLIHSTILAAKNLIPPSSLPGICRNCDAVTPLSSLTVRFRSPYCVCVTMSIKKMLSYEIFSTIKYYPYKFKSKKKLYG